MDRIGVRELRQNASRYLAQVAATGGAIEITDRGRPIARLVPVTGDEWSDLVAAGEVTPADGTLDIRDVEPVESAVNASDALARLRDQER